MIYEQMPENFHPKFETAACFIESDGEFLLLKRQTNKPFGGTWCLPGGKRDVSETLRACAKRETFEETAITLDEEAISPVKTVYVDNSGLQYLYHMFKIPVSARPMPDLKLSEHSEFMWCSPSKALSMNLIPGQDVCIRMAYQI